MSGFSFSASIVACTMPLSKPHVGEEGLLASKGTFSSSTSRLAHVLFAWLVWLCKDFSGYTKTRQNQTQGDTCRSHVLSLLIVTDNQSGLGCFFLHAIHILCSVLMFPSEVTLLCFVVGGEAKTLSSVSPASNRAYSL